MVHHASDRFPLSVAESALDASLDILDNHYASLALCNNKP
jgi:hypothetical protein